MPAASIPAFALHSINPVYRFGLEAEPANMFLHEVKDTADRVRGRIMDENVGISVYEYFGDASITYAIDCHVRAQSGIQNQHPGSSVSGSALNILVGEAPFKFSLTTGEFVFQKPSRTRRAGEFHQVNFEILHLFPEDDIFSSFYGQDIDNSLSTPIDVGGGADGGGVIDPITGTEALRTYRLHYHFEPARGFDAAARNGYVTRVLSSSTTPDVDQLLSYNNPPDLVWQSTPSNSVAIPSGCYWTRTDSTADTEVGEPGIYTLTGIYQLEGSETEGVWLYEHPDLVASPKEQDTTAYGTDVVVVRYTNGTKRIILGDLPDLAAVRTHLGLANNSTLTAVYHAKTATYFHGEAVTGLDELAFWRFSKAQPVGPNYLQIYEIFGERTPASNYHYLRCTYNNFDPEKVMFGAPNPPPPTHYNLATSASAYLMDGDPAAIYNFNTPAYDVGNSSAVSALGITPPTTGDDLWIFQRGSGLGSISNTWDYLRANANTTGGFWTAMGHSGSYSEDTPKYKVLFHANGNNGKGKYYIGNSSMGNPWDVIGLSLY